MRHICSIYTILPKNPLLFLHIPIPSPLLYLKHPLRQRVRYTLIKSTFTPIAPSSINHHHSISPHQPSFKLNTLNELISFFSKSHTPPTINIAQILNQLIQEIYTFLPIQQLLKNKFYRTPNPITHSNNSHILISTQTIKSNKIYLFLNFNP